MSEHHAPSRRWQVLFLLCLVSGILISPAWARDPFDDSEGDLWQSRPAGRHGYGNDPTALEDQWLATPSEHGWHRPPLARYMPLADGPVGPPSRPPAPGHRYWCDSPAGYYPFIYACRANWRSVSSEPLR